MTFILDHLLSVIIGATLIVTLLTIQFRERQTAISNTVAHTVRISMNETLEPVADDIENIWSPARLGNVGTIDVDTFQMGPYVGRGLTRSFRFPAKVRVSATDSSLRATAQVQYDLVPLGTQANVTGEWHDQFGLVRTIDFSPYGDPLSAGVSIGPDTLSRLLIDFKVGYIEGLNSGSMMTRRGAPDDDAHAVHLSALGARPAPDSTLRGRATETPFNAVPFSRTVRLLNF